MSERVVIVTGARDWQDADAVWRVLDECQPTCVVQGGCPSGADAHARAWADRHGVYTETWHAAWRVHGAAAGPIRNRRMLQAHLRAPVLAFPLGGPGTRDCIQQARGLGMLVRVYEP